MLVQASAPDAPVTLVAVGRQERPLQALLVELLPLLEASGMGRCPGVGGLDPLGYWVRVGRWLVLDLPVDRNGPLVTPAVRSRHLHHCVCGDGVPPLSVLKWAQLNISPFPHSRTVRGSAGCCHRPLR